jgi:hypothetical protein
MNDINDQNEKDTQKPSITQVMASVLASFFGVQSSKNKERDFQHGNYRVFAIMGIAVTAGFIGGLYLLVQLVIHLTAK